jgi:hypothetical protein
MHGYHPLPDFNKAGPGTAPLYERTNLNAYLNDVGYAFRRPLSL